MDAWKKDYKNMKMQGRTETVLLSCKEKQNVLRGRPVLLAVTIEGITLHNDYSQWNHEL